MSMPVALETAAEQSRFNFLKLTTLLLIAFCYSFVSINEYTATPLSKILFTIFLDGPMNSYVSLFGIFVILMLLVWFISSKFSLSKSSVGVKFFFFVSLLFSVYKILNPNNNDYITFLGVPLIFLFENILGVCILYAMLTMVKKDFVLFVKLLFTLISILLLFRGILLGAFWIVGEGNRFLYGVNSILLEYDTLIVYGLFHTLFLGIFLLKRKINFLILSLFFLTVVLLSFRRSPLMVCLTSDLFLILAVFFRASLSKKLLALAIPIFLAGVILMLREVIPATDFWINRYTGIFTGAEGNTNLGGDSGHTQQTVLTTLGAAEIGFWGKGIGKKIELPGAFQRTVTHNIYAAVWACHGILAFVFYFGTFVYSIFRSLALLFSTSGKSLEYTILGIVPISFYAGYMLAMWFAPSFYVESLKMFLFLTILMAYDLKFNQEFLDSLFTK